MTLLEQIILCLLQNYANPLFEPIIIDRRVLNIFSDITPNTKQLKKAKRSIAQFADDSFSTSILKTNMVRLVDMFIQIQEEHDATISQLTSENKYLSDQNARLQRELKTKPTATTKNLVLDANSSQLLKNAMTIYCTVR
jgi:hypothetical protein